MPSVAEFLSESYMMTGAPKELPFVGDAAVTSLKPHLVSPHLSALTSWKMIALYLQLGRDKDAMREKLVKLAPSLNVGDNISKMIDALHTKICSQGLKLYISLSDHVSQTTCMKDTERTEFMLKAYDQNPVKYLKGFGEKTLEALAEKLGKEPADVQTDDFVALILTLMPIDPSADVGACDKIYYFLTKELGVKGYASSIIDQLQCRLALGLEVEDKAKVEEYISWRKTWKRSATTGRMASVTEEEPLTQGVGKKQKSRS